MNDKPRSLGSREVLDARRAQLREPHVVRLTAFVDKLRAETGGRFPYFDPLDGGVGAEVLFLFETPGRQADKSGFVSRNNPDPSANNFFEFNRKARFKRERTISWNIVPWYIGSDSKNGSVKPAECEKGIRQLERLLKLLPETAGSSVFWKDSPTRCNTDCKSAAISTLPGAASESSVCQSQRRQ